MTFGEALVELKAGRSMTRTGWNGANMSVTIQNPDSSSKMTLPYIYITTVSGNNVPWLASQSDMLADDWVAIP